MSTPQRIFWLDAAKAYGMFLVYYGHIVERFYQIGGNQAALLQDRLVYSFHMPLFFFLSGFFARQRPDSLGTFLGKGLLTRLLPVVVLSLLIIPGKAVEHFMPPDLSDYSSRFRARWFDDWPDLCRRIASTAENPQARARTELRQALPANVQETIQAGAQADSLTQTERTLVLDGLNAAMDGTPYDLSDPSYISATRVVRYMLADGADALAAQERRRLNVTLTWATLFPEWAGEDGFWEELWDDITFFYPGAFPLNIPTWFLIGLLVVETYHFLVGRFLHSTPRLLAAIAVFGVGGNYINHDAPLWSDIFFAREGVLLYAFYLLGLLLRRTQALERLSPRRALALFALGAATLLGTFDLNPLPDDLMPVVLINLSQHGDPYYFVVTAVAGCLAVAGLALLTPQWRWVSWIGSHTLLLMGCNGFFFAFVNRPLARTFPIDDSHAAVFLWVTAYTLVSLALSVPFAMLLNRYVPQLVGRPRQTGPLLPQLMREK